MLLTNLKQGEVGVITRVKGIGAFRKRIMEMGFIVGKPVKVIRKAPLKDPVEYCVLGYNVSIRNSEAELIEVEKINDDSIDEICSKCDKAEAEAVIGDFNNNHKAQYNKLYLSFVGNPNSGKTTLFNKIGRANERVGNYAGVTVAAKELNVNKNGIDYKITDLPGTYSLTAYSPEELFVRDYILKNLPDVVVNVVDATNLERSLYLTTQLIDMDIKVVLALNMYDEFEQSGNTLDYEYLGKLIGIPIVPTVATRGRGIHNLLKKAADVAHDKDKTVRHIHINYGETIEKAISEIRAELKKADDVAIFNRVSERFFAIKLIEKDPEVVKLAQDLSNFQSIDNVVKRNIKTIEKQFGDTAENIFTDAKYAFISGALKETLKRKKKLNANQSDKIDNILTNKYLGIPIFLFFMWLTFYTTFTLGAYPQEWIESFVIWLSGVFVNNFPDTILNHLIVDGILAGVGGVLAFLPNILILYFFISLMEDTGYMARAVFIMDKFMHKIGLHGKSFIPLLMGFGCNVPAIMSTRIIESKRDRLITMLINPFMSCSARLPVYVLFITAFFNKHQGTILFSIYISGILIAVLTALLLQKTLFKKIDIPFVMELPPYRMPTVRNTVFQMINRTNMYLKKIGGIILIASVIIWVLNYFPRNFEGAKEYDAKIAKLETVSTELSSQESQNSAKLTAVQDSIRIISAEKKYKQQENSYIGRVGRFIEPAMKPLGFDWKMSVAVLTGVAAKEVVVGTLGVLYHSPDAESATLVDNLKRQYEINKDFSNKSPRLVAISFMIFILIYFPCVGVIAAISRESGNWKWALFVVLYSTGLAYVVSLLIFQIGSIF